MFGFSAIILAPDMLEKPIKSSKDLDDSLVSKKPWNWRPEPGKVGQKMQKHPHL